MFLLIAIPIGLAVGLVAGGRIERLQAVRFRWAPLAVGGFLVQVALFTEAGGRLAGDLAPAVYVASTLAVFAAVARNLAVPGVTLVAAGALLNLAAIASNGGHMPADPGALRLAGFDGPGAYTNSIVAVDPALQPLTDIYAIPAGVPLANVFSVGDVLIGLGVAVAIAAAMRGGVRPVEVASAGNSGSSAS